MLGAAASPAKSDRLQAEQPQHREPAILDMLRAISEHLNLRLLASACLHWQNKERATDVASLRTWSRSRTSPPGAYGPTSFCGSEGPSTHPGGAHLPRYLTYGRSHGAGRRISPVDARTTTEGDVTHQALVRANAHRGRRPNPRKLRSGPSTLTGIFDSIPVSSLLTRIRKRTRSKRGQRSRLPVKPNLLRWLGSIDAHHGSRAWQAKRALRTDVPYVADYTRHGFSRTTLSRDSRKPLASPPWTATGYLRQGRY